MGIGRKDERKEKRKKKKEWEGSRRETRVGETRVEGEWERAEESREKRVGRKE